MSLLALLQSFISDLSPIVLIIILVMMGEIFLVLEFFVIPGFGAGGIMGILTLLAGAAMAWSSYGAGFGLLVFIFSLITSGFIIYAGMRSNFSKKRFILTQSLAQGTGQGTAEKKMNISDTGYTHTALRPSGVALIDGIKVDVQSEGIYIEAGTPIEIIRIDGPQIVVAINDKIDTDKNELPVLND